jgi:hypothetical protein
VADRVRLGGGFVDGAGRGVQRPLVAVELLIQRDQFRQAAGVGGAVLAGDRQASECLEIVRLRGAVPRPVTIDVGDEPAKSGLSGRSSRAGRASESLRCGACL